jgi:hypothetical protein
MYEKDPCMGSKEIRQRILGPRSVLEAFRLSHRVFYELWVCVCVFFCLDNNYGNY